MTAARSFLRAENGSRLGIVVELLALIRCLAEFYRLRYLAGASFDLTAAEPFILGALVAAVFCLASVLLHFAGRWRGSLAVAILCVAALLVLKFSIIGA